MYNLTDELNNDDLQKSMDVIMERIFYSELQPKEKRIALNKMLFNYTEKKINNLDLNLDDSNGDFKLLISKFNILVSKSYYKNQFLDNYTLFLVKLLGREQDASISWLHDNSSNRMKTRIINESRKIDAIITSESSNNIDVLIDMYNLYTESLDNSIKMGSYSKKVRY